MLQVDLKAQGITDYGTFAPGGFGSGRGFKTSPLLELYFNGQPMPLSRWPNTGYVSISNLLTATDVEAHGLKGSKTGLFTYSDDRPKRWKDEQDLWLYGYWFWDWADSYEKVAAIDTDKKTITLAEPFHNYGYRAGQRYCAVNLLSEIDQPGEWYLDRTRGLLYFYPPSTPEMATIEISMLDKPVMELNTVSHVVFERLLWENGRADGVLVKGGASCLFAGCTIRKFGGNGIEIRGGTRHGLLTCEIHTLGRGGAVVEAGDRRTLEPGGHFIENCRIHHVSRIDHTYTPCVLLRGVGNQIRHCSLHDSTSSAMRVEGNDHRIEYNDVFRVLLESDDQGGSDSFGNPTYRGTAYRFNYWHDMGNGLGCGQAGIRLDDAISGTLIYGNVFERCADGGFGGVQIHGGKENIVENNLFVHCKAAVSFSPWGAARWKEWLEGYAKKFIEDTRPGEPPYVTRYPELADLYANVDTNRIWHNVALNCDQFLLRDSAHNDAKDNWVVSDDRVAAHTLDFRAWATKALSNRPDFQPIPFEDIGLYPDAYRQDPSSP